LEDKKKLSFIKSTKNVITATAMNFLIFMFNLNGDLIEYLFPFADKRPDKNKDPQRNCPPSEQIDQEDQKRCSGISPRCDDGGQKVDE